MCSKCRRMFFIEVKEDDDSLEMNMKTFQSPCCRPFYNKYMKRDQHPTGVYIRTLTMEVTDIPDEIALVNKRRVADEQGKGDPYR